MSDGRKIWLIAVAVSLLVSVAACNRRNKAEQLAALDSAYQSGILTQEEYEAKKLALQGSAAPSLPAAPSRPDTPISPAQSAAAPKTAPAETSPTPANPAGESDTGSQEPAPVAGCEDAEYKSGKQSGTRERFFPMPLTTVKNAAAAALKTLDFSIRKEANNEIEASKKRHIGVLVGAGGERVFLHFREAQQGGQEGTLVTGETKKSFVGRVTRKSWTNAVLAQIACVLRNALPR